MKPFRAASGGDWSFCEVGAVELTRTARASVTGSSFLALGGNGVLVAGGNVNASVIGCEFHGLGESAVVAAGAAGGGQAPPLDSVPVGTRVASSVFSDLGIFVKQAGAFYSALAANSTVVGNIAFNLPRAAINVNDGAFGGHVIEANLFFGTVRETADHGCINSWEREPYVRGFDATTGAPILYGAESRCTGNFLINGGYGIHPLDHDDGSNAWRDEGNVLAFAGVKNWQGLNKTAAKNLIVRPDYCPACVPGAHANAAGNIPLPASYYFPACVRSLGQARWGALRDSYVNNSCILAAASPYIFGTCNASSPNAAGDIPDAHDNEFITPGASVEILCGGKTLSLADAQAVGYELGSRAVDNTLTPADTVAMIEAMLGFSSVLGFS